MHGCQNGTGCRGSVKVVWCHHPILFDQFLRIPSLHVLVFVQKKKTHSCDFKSWNKTRICLCWWCKCICFFTDAIAYSGAFFGAGSGPIHLDDVACTGSEAALMNCSYDPITSDCSHFEDAGVQCQGKAK